jgi:hypothetical protein
MDPMEQIIADALDEAGIAFTTPSQRRDATGLDFRLENGVEIEVKRFHSPRIAEQMSRAPNVIAVQGEAAVRLLADTIRQRHEL